jgi:hypothetical protein
VEWAEGKIPLPMAFSLQNLITKAFDCLEACQLAPGNGIHFFCLIAASLVD